MLAAACTQPEMVSLLRSRGASLEAEDRYGRTAIMVAAEVGDATVFNCLFDGTLDEALLYAAADGHGTLARQLIEAGASVEAQSDSGTALIVASRNDQSLVVNILIDQSVNLDA